METMMKILVRSLRVGYETLNEATGELSLFDSMDEIVEYAKQENLKFEYGDWSDEETGS